MTLREVDKLIEHAWGHGWTAWAEHITDTEWALVVSAYWTLCPQRYNSIEDYYRQIRRLGVKK